MDLPDTPHHLATWAADRRQFDRVLDVLWLLWIASLPLAHLTGAHNTLAVVVIILSLLRTGAAGLADTPALAWLIAFTALASLSLAWSPLPAVSGGKLRSDLLLPLFGYVAAFCWARQGGAKPIFLGMAAGLLLLAVFSAIELIPADVTARWPGLDAADPAGHRYPHLYPGVGDASADAILVIAPMLVWRWLAGHWRDLTSLLLGLAAIVVIGASKNRESVFLLPFALALFAALWSWSHPAKRSRLPVGWLIAIAIVITIAALLMLELISQRRLAEAHVVVPFGNAAMTLFALDPRPQMWAEYLHLGAAHRYFGAGFGRTVPAQAYDVVHDPVMIRAHANLFEHAHDYLLNVWLQLGLAGLILIAGALISAIRSAARGLSRDSLTALAGCGALTLMVTTLLRNAVDDFLVYSMASAFWVSLGVLFGLMRPAVAQARGAASK